MCFLLKKYFIVMNIFLNYLHMLINTCIVDVSYGF